MLKGIQCVREFHGEINGGHYIISYWSGRKRIVNGYYDLPETVKKFINGGYVNKTVGNLETRYWGC